jgi:phosphatidylglycerol lysyltransferase
VEQCDREGRVPVIYQSSLDSTRLEGDWRSVPVGDEAVIDLASFSLAGKTRGNVRRSHRRALDEGWTMRFFHNVVDDAGLARQADALSAAWVSAKGGNEMGFSMGPFKCETPDCWWALAVDARGVVQVVLSWVPNYGRRGWTLDVMRRAPRAPSHAMDFAIVAAILHWQERGAKLASLGLAPLANHHGVGPLWWRRVMAFVGSRRWGGYNCNSLEAYKSKFADRWEPRYLVYPRRRLLQAILASACAHQAVGLPTRRRSEPAATAHTLVSAAA